MFPKFSQIKRDASRGLKNIWGETFLREFVLLLIGGVTNAGAILYSIGFLIYFNIAAKIFDNAEYLDMLNKVNMIVLIVVAVSLIQIGFRSGMKVGMNKYYLEIAEKPLDQPKSGLKSHLKNFAPQMMLEFGKDICISLLTLLFILPGIISSIQWSMAEFIIADDPETRATDAMRESRYLMEGYKMKYLLFNISFIPLFLLCILSFGIGFIWFIPYVKACKAKFYYYLIHPEFRVDKKLNELQSLKAEHFSWDDFEQEYEEKTRKKEEKLNKRNVRR
jgi:uncharacterized membrane protein